MKKYFKLGSVIAALILGVVLLLAAKPLDELKIGVVDFDLCIEKAKISTDKQKSLQAIQTEFNNQIEPTKKEWEELNKELTDKNKVDLMSTKVEKEKRDKKNLLEKALDEHAYRYNQMFQQARMQVLLSARNASNSASEIVAKNKKLLLVVDKSVAFYSNKALNISEDVIKQMNTTYDEELKEQKKAEEKKKKEEAKDKKKQEAEDKKKEVEDKK